jgi:hypothetical protein
MDWPSWISRHDQSFLHPASSLIWTRIEPQLDKENMS